MYVQAAAMAECTAEIRSVIIHVHMNTGNAYVQGDTVYFRASCQLLSNVDFKIKLSFRAKYALIDLNFRVERATRTTHGSCWKIRFSLFRNTRIVPTNKVYTYQQGRIYGGLKKLQPYPPSKFQKNVLSCDQI